jgi:hypothetical protein
MKSPMLRFIATIVLATMGVLTGDTSGNACLFPWFGCGGSPCGAGYCGGYYRPTYAAYYPTGPYYSPCCGGGCSSGCAPSCGSCCGATYPSCNLGCCPVASSCSPWGCPVSGCCGTVSGCCGAGAPGSSCAAGPSSAGPSPPPAAHPPGTDGKFQPRSYEPPPGTDTDRPANPKTTGAAQPAPGTDPAYEKPRPSGPDASPTPQPYKRNNNPGAEGPSSATSDGKSADVPQTFAPPAPPKATSDQQKKSDPADGNQLFDAKKPTAPPETPPPSGKKAPMPKDLNDPKATDLEPSGPALQLQDRPTWHVTAMRQPVVVGVKTAAAPVPERITSTSAEWVLLPVDTRLARE